MAEAVDPPDALAALLDPRRLAVAGSLATRTRTVDEVADHADLDRTVVLQAIGELRRVGLAEAAGDGFVLSVDGLRALARQVTEAATPMDPTIGYGMTDAERQVLERFFSGRTLNQIPTDRPKRLIVLERLALEFDIGRRYSEPEVDEALRAFHLDVASLRRSLVDEELLSRAREDGETRYWRSGGRVPTIA